jgi:hypothetical protein
MTRIPQGGGHGDERSEVAPTRCRRDEDPHPVSVSPVPVATLTLAMSGDVPERRPGGRSADRRKQSGDRGNRTPDLFHAMEALYQLSYIPVRAAHSSIVPDRPERLQVGLGCR